MANKILLSTSEVSGDLITSHLVKNLLLLDDTVLLSAIAGKKTAATKIKMVADSLAIGSMRIGWVPLHQLREYYRERKSLKEKAISYLEKENPDLVVLVDLNGFNAYLLVELIKRKKPYLCYIPSQEWVLGKMTKQMNLVLQSKAKVISIFPEEDIFYKARGIDSVYLGHPLVDICKDKISKEEARKNLGMSKDQTIITLLPFSRKQELSYIFPVVLKTAEKIQKQQPKVHFCFSLARADLKSKVETMLENFKGLSISFSEDNYSAIKAADLVIAKSGTVNLETALMGTPQIIFYRLGSLSYFVVKNILRVKLPKFISAVNIFMGRKVICEFVQKEASPENLSREALTMLNMRKNNKKEDIYKGLKEIMGAKDSLKRTAQTILKQLEVKL